MRLGLIIYGSLDTVSGGYLYDRRLVEYLQRQGDQVEIITLPWRNYAWHVTDNLSTGLFRRLSSLQVDVLLQDELNHPSLFWLNHRLAGKVAYPLAAIVHNLRSSEHRPAWQKRIYALVEKRFLKTVHGFIFNSQTTRQVVENAGIDLDCLPWVIAYPAGDNFSKTVSEEFIRQRAAQAGPLHIVFVANVIKGKGLHVLLDAISLLPPGTCSLDVVGSLEKDPGYARQVQQQSASLGSNCVVRFHGSLDHNSMQGILQQSHVLAVPSFYEGFGIVYLEGMSFGLPAIAGSLGAAHEIITPGENGYLVQPGDSTGLARMINLISTDRARLAHMGVTALHRFQRQPTWDDMGRGVREFLLQMRKPA